MTTPKKKSAAKSNKAKSGGTKAKKSVKKK